MSDHKLMTRSICRHHIARLKKTRQYYWESGWEGKQVPLDVRRLGIVVSTPKVCSCWMCSNPRRVFKHPETLQELRANQRECGIDSDSDA